MTNPPPTTLPDLWYGTSGPQDAPIVIIGEAWGQEEDIVKRPFVGSSGQDLTRMLAEAGINRDQCLITNVVAHRPQNNNMWTLFHPHDKKQPTVQGLQPTQFVIDEVKRLYKQIAAHPRQLIITTGNYALWAMTDCTGYEVKAETFGRRVPNGIMNWRGSMIYALKDRFATKSEVSSTRLLPIIHPAAIQRQWALRAVTVHDLKARVPMAKKGDWRQSPSPVFLAPPTFEQATSRLKMWLAAADRGEKVELAEDIETIPTKGIITCIGFCDSPNFAMSIPFIDKTDTPGVFEHYWPVDKMVVLWRLINRINSHPNILIEGQNFLYDMQYIHHWLGVIPWPDHDTMLSHHLCWPGTPKGLDYLSSLYCQYHWYWKEDSKEWDGKGRLEDLLLYNCFDCRQTREVAQTMRKLITQLKLDEQWKETMEKNALAFRMMQRGVLIDQGARHTLTIQMFEALTSIHERLARIVPQDMVQPKAKVPWFRSAQQQKVLFYDILGMRKMMNRKTGRPTLDADAMTELPKRYPELTLVFKLLEASRSAGVFYNTFLKAQLESDGRMRCFFKPAGTETFRWSSSKNVFKRGANMQNLSEGDEE